MKKRSKAWTWFLSGCALSAVASAIMTVRAVNNLLSDAGAQADPALAVPTIAVVTTGIMTFFGLLVPLMALCGLLVVMIDGFTRSRR
jgi:hypothetical protein